MDNASPVCKILACQSAADHALGDNWGMYKSSTSVMELKCLQWPRVVVLDGGYPAWQAVGYEVDSSQVSQEEVAAGARAAALQSSSPQYQPQKQVVDSISVFKQT